MSALCLTEPLTSDPPPAAQGGWETPPGLHGQGWGGPCDPSVNPEPAPEPSLLYCLRLDFR